VNTWVAGDERLRVSGAARYVKPGVAAAGLAAGCLYVGLLDPNHSHAFIACPFHELTGLWCPGCGATRAAHALLNGHLGVALHDNLLFVLAIPYVAYLFAAWAIRTAGGPVWRTWNAPNWALFTLIGLLVVFGVARNLPPFHALAP